MTLTFMSYVDQQAVMDGRMTMREAQVRTAMRCEAERIERKMLRIWDPPMARLLDDADDRHGRF